MTAELEKINGLLLNLKFRADELLDCFRNETITARMAKEGIVTMANIIYDSQVHMICYIEALKNHRRERRQQYRKNKKARKMDQSSLVTELYKIKI